MVCEKIKLFARCDACLERQTSLHQEQLLKYNRFIIFKKVNMHSNVIAIYEEASFRSQENTTHTRQKIGFTLDTFLKFL
jgi:hypothetical protein